MHDIRLYILLVILYKSKSCFSLSNHHQYDDNPEIREKYAQFHCFKLRTCTPGGDSVCGYDESKTYLAEFEDICTLHKVNCEKRGLFRHINTSICKDQKKFETASSKDVAGNKTSIL